MSGGEEQIGRLSEGHEDHDRRIGVLEEDMKGVRRFQTSFLAIMAAALATVAFWSKGLRDWLTGVG